MKENKNLEAEFTSSKVLHQKEVLNQVQHWEQKLEIERKKLTEAENEIALLKKNVSNNTKKNLVILNLNSED